MKIEYWFAPILLVSVSFGCSSDSSVTKSTETDRNVGSNQAVSGHVETKITDQVVEASCGQCQLGLEGKGCDLAVRIDGKSYYVDGSSIDDHGDAHGADGLCNCIRKAKVTGEVKDGRFVAEKFQVLRHKD